MKLMQTPYSWKNSILIFFLFHGALLSSYAQTTNTGTLYVSPQTVFSTIDDFANTPSGEFFNDGDAFIYADFSNDGLVDFYQETGTTRFIGSTIQQITGSELSAFYNIVFDNYSNEVPFHLSGEIGVFGQANFQQGIVDVDNYMGSFLFDTQASHQNTSDNSHVDGAVEKYGDTDFIYPIGDKGYYRFAGISAPSSGSSIYSAKYFFEDPNGIYNRASKQDHIDIVNDQEYWTIQPLTPAQDILITLSWSDATTPSELLIEPVEDNLHIVRWDDQNRIWVDEGGVADLEKQTITTNVDTFGVFTLALVKSQKNNTVKVFNAITRNSDGINDRFVIDFGDVQGVQKVQVEIYNRWGVKVFETDNYGHGGDFFDGYSKGRLTVREGERLPAGTYFYVLNYQYNENEEVRYNKQAGYLYLY